MHARPAAAGVGAEAEASSSANLFCLKSAGKQAGLRLKQVALVDADTSHP